MPRRCGDFPNIDLRIEIATNSDTQDPIGADDWIDPEVVELVGISKDELQRFIKPADYEGQGGSVAQPAYNTEGYHPHMPEEIIKAMIEMPDALVTETFCEPTPPSKMRNEDKTAKHKSS